MNKTMGSPFQRVSAPSGPGFSVLLCLSTPPSSSALLEYPFLPSSPSLLPSPLPSREKWHFVTWVTQQPLLPSREPKILASQSDSIFVCTHYTPPLCRNLHRFNQTLFLYNFNQFLL